jgi:hypothetical protein
MKIKIPLTYLFALALGSLLAASFARASDGDKANAKPKATKVSIAAGSLEEVCVRLKAKEKLRYEFSATAKLQFSIHYHDGDKVEFPVAEHLTASETDLFTASAPQTYCLMWENIGTEPVELKLQHQKWNASM